MQTRSTWKNLDKLYPYILLFTVSVVAAAARESFFLFTVTFSGLLCVILAARGNIGTYPVGLYNCVAYAYVAYTNGLYGEMGLNLLFFVPTSIAGWFLWKNKMKDRVVLMRCMSATKRVWLFVACAVCTVGLGLALSLIDTQKTPYIDALTNVLSVAATFLMMYRFQEQWFLYISLNVFTVLMWSIRWFQGSPEGRMMVLMWALYLVNSFYGAVKWHLGAQKNRDLL